MKAGKAMVVKQGPNFKLSPEIENELEEYLLYCLAMGDPREKSAVALQIVHFLDSYKLENKFKTKKPGNIS